MAAILLAAIALTNLLMLLIGYQPREDLQETPVKIGVAAFGVLGTTVAFFVWRLKAWALLIMQAMLAISALALFASLLYVSSVMSGVFIVVVFVVFVSLFSKLVRVLARAQAPAPAVDLGGSPGAQAAPGPVGPTPGAPASTPPNPE